MAMDAVSRTARSEVPTIDPRPRTGTKEAPLTSEARTGPDGTWQQPWTVQQTTEPWTGGGTSPPAPALMSVHDNIMAWARAWPARGTRIDPTVVHLSVWCWTGTACVRGTIVQARDDAFEREWSWPHGVFRYAVQLDRPDGPGPVLPWVDARHVWVAVRKNGKERI